MRTESFLGTAALVAAAIVLLLLPSVSASPTLETGPAWVKYSDDLNNSAFVGCQTSPDGFTLCGSFTHVTDLGGGFFYGPGAGVYFFTDHVCVSGRAGFGTPVANVCKDSSPTGVWVFLS
jgi:hypothetical protein